jgi:hypothetical protein
LLHALRREHKAGRRRVGGERNLTQGGEGAV